MAQVHIVGVSGKAGAGKDTLVDYLRQELRQRNGDGLVIATHQVALAKAVKDFGTTYFGNICDPVVKDPVSRFVLQGIGQMMRQEVRDDFWIQKTREKVTQLVDNHDRNYIPTTHVIVFITDVRYKNEADALQPNADFYLGEKLSLNHLLRINGRTALTGEAAQHASETDLDDYDKFTYVYNNVGTLENLYGFGDAFLERTLYDA